MKNLYDRVADRVLSAVERIVPRAADEVRGGPTLPGQRQVKAHEFEQILSDYLENDSDVARKKLDAIIDASFREAEAKRASKTWPLGEIKIPGMNEEL